MPDMNPYLLHNTSVHTHFPSTSYMQPTSFKSYCIYKSIYKLALLRSCNTTPHYTDYVAFVDTPLPKICVCNKSTVTKICFLLGRITNGWRTNDIQNLVLSWGSLVMFKQVKNLQNYSFWIKVNLLYTLVHLKTLFHIKTLKNLIKDITIYRNKTHDTYIG